jgi:hypothetical protein
MHFILRARYNPIVSALALMFMTNEAGKGYTKKMRKP